MTNGFINLILLDFWIKELKFRLNNAIIQLYLPFEYQILVRALHTHETGYMKARKWSADLSYLRKIQGFVSDRLAFKLSCKSQAWNEKMTTMLSKACVQRAQGRGEIYGIESLFPWLLWLFISNQKNSRVDWNLHVWHIKEQGLHSVEVLNLWFRIESNIWSI